MNTLQKVCSLSSPSLTCDEQSRDGFPVTTYTLKNIDSNLITIWTASFTYVEAYLVKRIELGAFEDKESAINGAIKILKNNGITASSLEDKTVLQVKSHISVTQTQVWNAENIPTTLKI